MYATSAEGRHKVYIVDEAHMLTREAWNALLKILEEPPSAVVFVFATTEPQKIAQSAAPILSRLQRFDFRRIGPAAIVERLRQVVAAERLEAADEALHLIAKSADGRMRDGLSILDQVVSFGSGPVTADRVREVLGLIPDDVYGELLRVVAIHVVRDQTERSEEHTSELQSRRDLVCRLLLEKKNGKEFDQQLAAVDQA